MDKEFWKSNVGVRNNFHSHILSKDKMRDLGFTHYADDCWYFLRTVGEGISLNIVIADDNSFLGIKVLLEDHLKPYSYEEALKEDYKLAESVNIEVNKWLNYLQSAGVLERG